MDTFLFKSAHEALVFASNFSHQVYTPSTMNRMMAPITGSGGKGLGGLDGAAQAGMVLKELNILPQIQARSLYCRVAPKHLDCSCGSPCCSKRKPNQEWYDQFSYLITYLRDEVHSLKQPGLRGLADLPLLRRGLALKFFGEQINLKSLSEQSEVTEATVSNHKAIYNGILRNAEKAGWDAFDKRLRLVGMVGEE